MKYKQKSTTLFVEKNEAADKVLCMVENLKQITADHTIINRVTALVAQILGGKGQEGNFERCVKWKDELIQSISYLKIYRKKFINELNLHLSNAIDFEFKTVKPTVDCEVHYFGVKYLVNVDKTDPFNIKIKFLNLDGEVFFYLGADFSLVNQKPLHNAIWVETRYMVAWANLIPAIIKPTEEYHTVKEVNLTYRKYELI